MFCSGRQPLSWRSSSPTPPRPALPTPRAQPSLTRRPQQLPADCVLFERYKAFNGAADKGLGESVCELIDNNGKELQKCCNSYAADSGLAAGLYRLDEQRQHLPAPPRRTAPLRLHPRCTGAGRSGRGGRSPRHGVDVGEVFGVWVIEGPAWLEELPFKKAGRQVASVPDATPYKKRKVRILNRRTHRLCAGRLPGRLRRCGTACTTTPSATL